MSKSTATHSVKAYITPVWTTTFKRCRARQSPLPATVSPLRPLRSVATLTSTVNSVHQCRSMSASAVQTVVPDTESAEMFSDEPAASSAQQLDSGPTEDQNVQVTQARSNGTTSNPVFPLYRPELSVFTDPNEPEIAMPSSRAELKLAVQQLEQETRALESQAAQAEKLQLTHETTADLPPYTEAELEEFYRSVMASPSRSTNTRIGLLSAPQTANTSGLLGPGEETEGEPRRKMIRRPERKEILRGLEERLTFYQGQTEEMAASPGTATEDTIASADVGQTRLASRNGTKVPAKISRKDLASRREVVHKRLLGLIQNVTEASVEQPPVQQSTSPVEVSTDKSFPEAVSPTVQTGLVSRSEFLALFDDCVSNQDLSTASQVLDSMRDHGLTVPASEITSLLEGYAKKGDPTGLAGLLAKEEQMQRSPSRSQLATLVQAHLSAGKKHQAVHLLHDFEARQLTLPQSAYRSVIDTLLAPSPTMTQADKALAWDLFTHMRLVAHPVPSVELYNTMIRACADPKDPQPEVALDMFTQMVQENQQTPTADTYNMMIRALAKVKKYYYESFRLLRQMLEVHQAALQAGLAPGQVETGYEPTVVTFNALLEGTKRMGDLGRARWILAEMAKIGAFVGDGGHTKMLSNEETMVNIFHTYAAFTPLVVRADIKVAASKASAQTEASSRSDSAPSTGQQDSAVALDEPIERQETQDHVPRPVSLLDIGSPDFVPPYQPQTAYEAFAEASQLFDLVLYNIASQEGAFRQVAPTPRLINAYLSVALAHVPLDKALHLQMGIWHDERIVGLQQNLGPNGWTYLFALERCAAAKTKPEKRFLAEDDVLERLWQEYERWYTKKVAVVHRLTDERTSRASEPSLAQEQGDRYRLNVGLGPREVERCWVAVIAAFALIENTSRALQLLGDFRDRFPPDAIISAYSPSPRFANKIRFNPSQRILEDNIPPHILFHDVERLHHRFVRDGDLQAVGKIKWTTLGYQLALEKRKSMRLAETKVKKSYKTSMT
ncbi:hypothetical protein QFC21_002646 [Naganishia friedmannii]|uniref:Uncharacterized protein n=1 Tax=Naganishia friedmannii TaxID=89922 RepID=A0ACC2VUZ5_9TREE|nr:hypothetical protein QFC21_002646 [Naganishia friedmannii]